MSLFLRVCLCARLCVSLLLSPRLTRQVIRHNLDPKPGSETAKHLTTEYPLNCSEAPSEQFRMHACMHTYIHTYIRTHVSYIRPSLRPSIQPSIHASIRLFNACMHAWRKHKRISIGHKHEHRWRRYNVHRAVSPKCKTPLEIAKFGKRKLTEGASWESPTWAESKGSSKAPGHRKSASLGS